MMSKNVVVACCWRKWSFVTFFNIISFALMINCGVKVGNPSDSDEDAHEVNGSVVMGLVSQATVSLYSINADGSRGELLAETQTSDNGTYNLKYAGPKPYLIVASSGTYEDEATGEIVSNDEIEAIFSEQPSNKYVSITALTTMASKNAIRNTGNDIEAAISSANQAVANIFGVSGLNILETNPVNLTVESSDVDPSANESKYGLILSGLSQVARDNGLDSSDLPNLVSALAEDYSDGGFDGNSDDETDLGISGLTPDTAMQGLNSAMDNFLNGPRNLSGMAPVDISIKIPKIPTIGSEKPTIPQAPGGRP